MWAQRLLTTTLLLTTAALAASCAPVPAWARGSLVDRRMQPSASPERDGLRHHVQNVREGAAGGDGAAGGGCGCD
jgi:hypothetical protein